MKDYSTTLQFRLPVSLLRKIETAELGLTKQQRKRGGASESTRLLIMEGLVFLKLKQMQNNPEKKAKIMKLLTDAWKSENKEEYLETMEISELDNIELLVKMVKNRKINQKVLNF